MFRVLSAPSLFPLLQYKVSCPGRLPANPWNLWTWRCSMLPVPASSLERQPTRPANSVPPGQYPLQLNFMGFETKETAPFSVGGQGQELNLGKIPMAVSQNLLDEVEVAAERSTYNQHRAEGGQPGRMERNLIRQCRQPQPPKRQPPFGLWRRKLQRLRQLYFPARQYAPERTGHQDRQRQERNSSLNLRK